MSLTRTVTHTHVHALKKKQGRVRLLTGLGLDSRSWSWDLDWFQIATELYHVLKCVSLQVGHCVNGLYIIILMIILTVVVYDYYLSPLLAEDWHFEICLSLDAVA